MRDERELLEQNRLFYDLLWSGGSLVETQRVSNKKKAGPVWHRARRTAATRYSVVALRTSVDGLTATLVTVFVLTRSGAAGLAFTTATTGLSVLGADASLVASGQAIALAPTKASAIRKVFMGGSFHEFRAGKA